jgi:hypothetical protein
MIKQLFTPIQAWLLSQGRCVGCGQLLSRGKKQTIKSKTIISCRCGRMFVEHNGTYSRALFSEI